MIVQQLTVRVKQTTGDEGKSVWHEVNTMYPVRWMDGLAETVKRSPCQIFFKRL